MSAAPQKARHPALTTAACRLFGVRYPIVQTGMGWVAGARLTAATSAAGGLGILAAATLTLPELDAAIGRIKARTDQPFGVNLRGDQADVDDRCALLIDEGVRVASFARAPGEAVMRRLSEAGVITMPTVGAVRHAEKVTAWGAGALIAQGHEGGGHTGPVPTTLLLPAVCRATTVPVFGAGGFKDGRGLVAALAFGAAGVAMGTRFLLTQESTVPDDVKRAYLATNLTGTLVTTAVDGVPQRVIRTPFIDHLASNGPFARVLAAIRHALAFRKQTGASLWGLLREGFAMGRRAGLDASQVMMAANAPMLTRAALVDGRTDAGVLPAGQVVGSVDDLPTVAEVLEATMDEADAVLRALTSSAATDGAAA